MNNKTGMSINTLKWLLASIAMGAAAPSYSEYYIGLDATYINAKTIFSNGSAKFELAPARIKFGRRYEEFGWEIQGLAPSDDTGEFTGNGSINEYKLRGGIGVLMTVSTPNRNFFGGIGFTQIISDYGVLVNGQTVVSSTTSTPFTTLNLGGQFHITKNTHITMDYTFYHGQIDCNFCTDPALPAGYVVTDPDVRLSTFGIGLSYSF